MFLLCSRMGWYYVISHHVSVVIVLTGSSSSGKEYCLDILVSKLFFVLLWGGFVILGFICWLHIVIIWFYCLWNAVRLVFSFIFVDIVIKQVYRVDIFIILLMILCSNDTPLLLLKMWLFPHADLLCCHGHQVSVESRKD